MIIERRLRKGQNFIEHKITIVRIRKPTHNVNNELQWLGVSLGLFNLRDKDKSCFRLFIELLKAAKMDEPLSSDEIAERVGLSRGTVIHHLNKLIDAGIVIPHKGKYILRSNNIVDLVRELKRDMVQTFTNLEAVAEDIDGSLGL